MIYHLYSQRCFSFELGGFNSQHIRLRIVLCHFEVAVSQHIRLRIVLCHFEVAVSQHIRLRIVLCHFEVAVSQHTCCCWKLLPLVNTRLKKLTRALKLVTMVFSAVFCVYETLVLSCSFRN